MSELAYEAKTAVEAAGTLPPEALPERCGYLLLDGAGEVLSTNLTGRRLEAALERSPRGGLWSPYRLRLLEARQTDAPSTCSNTTTPSHYADPVLDGALPDFQTCWLLVGVSAAVLIIGWTTRRTGRPADRRRPAAVPGGRPGWRPGSWRARPSAGRACGNTSRPWLPCRPCGKNWPPACPPSGRPTAAGTSCSAP